MTAAESPYHVRAAVKYLKALLCVGREAAV